MEGGVALQSDWNDAKRRCRSHDRCRRANSEGLVTSVDVAAAFVRLESHLAARKGDFSFFALFLREEVPNRWDLIASAFWLGSDRTAAVQLLVDEIKSFLGTPYLIALSRIIIVDPNDPQLKAIGRSISTEHGP